MLDNMKLVWISGKSCYPTTVVHLPMNQHPSKNRRNSCCAITEKERLTSLEPVAIFPGYYVVMAYLAAHAFCFDGIGLVLVPGFTGANAGTIEEDRRGEENFGRGQCSGAMEICCV